MARIGLLSDSHGRASTTQRAVELLCQQGADILVHLGDVGTVEVIDALCVDTPGRSPDGHGQLEAHVVFGNTDWDRHTLARYAADLDVTVDDPLGRLELDDGLLVFCHGHDDADIAAGMAGHPRYFCHGHTHRQRDTRQGDTRIINPGALFRAEMYSVALLDTATDTLSFHEVPATA